VLSGVLRGARVPVGEIPTQQICHSSGRRRDGMNGNAGEPEEKQAP